MTNKNIAFLFLKIRETHASKLKNFGLTKIALLEVIAIRCFERKPLTVTKAMELKSIASPATIHRIIGELRDLGLIDYVNAKNSKRIKYLITTKKASHYFDQIALEMSSALVKT